MKRPLDSSLASLGLVILSPLFLVLTVIGMIAMKGNPFFVQVRPGRKDKTGREKVFALLKFRTMTNEKDENGELLPDGVRLNRYGRVLRSTSLDELPELINIIKGDMAIVGPRPQLVRDMVFMTEAQRHRHDVRQGLTGLAQVNGRNNTSWDERFVYDLEYVGKITFLGDLKIVLKTVKQVLIHDGITEPGMATAEDYGEWLLRMGQIDKHQFDVKQDEARDIILNLKLE